MAEVENIMATNARRPLKKSTTPAPAKRRVAVPRPAPPVVPEPEETETEELEGDGTEIGLDSVEELEEEEAAEEERQQRESVNEILKDVDLSVKGDEPSLDEMPVLTIEMIRDAKDRTEEWIPVKEWGGKMKIRSLSANAMFTMMGEDNTGITESGFTMDLSVVAMQKAIIMNGVVQPVITDAGFEILMEKSTAPVMKVLNSIMRVSKLGKDKDGKDPVEAEVATFLPTEQ